jgi:hypothetical protein
VVVVVGMGRELAKQEQTQQREVVSCHMTSPTQEHQEITHRPLTATKVVLAGCVVVASAVAATGTMGSWLEQRHCRQPRASTVHTSVVLDEHEQGSAISKGQEASL